MDSCLEELDDDIFSEDFDISEYQEYLEIGSHPDIEELGLADCLPEDF